MLRKVSALLSICLFPVSVVCIVMIFRGFPIVAFLPLFMALMYFGLIELMAGFFSVRAGGGHSAKIR